MSLLSKQSGELESTKLALVMDMGINCVLWKSNFRLKSLATLSLSFACIRLYVRAPFAVQGHRGERSERYSRMKKYLRSTRHGSKAETLFPAPYLSSVCIFCYNYELPKGFVPALTRQAGHEVSSRCCHWRNLTDKRKRCTSCKHTNTGMKESCALASCRQSKTHLRFARVLVSVVSGASAEDFRSSSHGHGLSDGGCG